MKRLGTRAPLAAACVVLLAQGASGAPSTAGSTTVGDLVRPHGVERVGSADQPQIVAAVKTYRLRWPARPGRIAVHYVRFKSPRIRSLTLRIYGITVPRGLGSSFIVACRHRGPASLDWDWSQAGGEVRVIVRMRAGRCFRPGRRVAGTVATVRLRSQVARGRRGAERSTNVDERARRDHRRPRRPDRSS
jgi:hypothetical protein